MKEKVIEQIFVDAGALVRGHFEYRSGNHGSLYINKKALYEGAATHTLALADLIAERTARTKVRIVVGPETGGVTLAIYTALGLVKRYSRGTVIAVGVKKTENGFAFIDDASQELVRGKKVLAVDDILTTGGSLAKVVRLLRKSKANVVGAAVLWNRGGVTPRTLGVKKLWALVTKRIPHWKPGACPLCKQGRALTTAGDGIPETPPTARVH